MVIVGLPVLHTELKEDVKNVDFAIKLAPVQVIWESIIYQIS